MDDNTKARRLRAVELLKSLADFARRKAEETGVPREMQLNIDRIENTIRRELEYDGMS